MDLLSLDRGLFYLINGGMANAFFDALMPVITDKGYLLMIPYLLVLFGKAHREKDGSALLRTALAAVILSLFAILLSDWLSHELKHIVGRPRPCKVLEGVHLLVGCTGSGSMPSNHATNSFAVALTLGGLLCRSVSPLLISLPLLLAGLIAFSRISVGVHYPSDVLAGALMGGLIALFMIQSFRRTVVSYRERPYRTVVIVSLLIISVFRIYYILHGPLDLSPDEAHYWEWARRLDLSYYSKGPMIAYIIHAGTALLGDTVIGVRWPAVIFSALSSLCLFRLGTALCASEAAGAVAALLFQAIPLYAPFGVLLTIDSPFLFFWILSLLLFWETVGGGNNPGTGREESRRSRGEDPGLLRWSLLGLSVGLGLLTKYTMAFFYPCALLLLVLSEKRHLLKRPGPYWSAFLSLLVFSPVVIWNIQHGWVTLKHTAGQAHVSEGLQFSFKYFFEFIGSQLGVVTPVIFVLIIVALFKLRKGEPRLQSLFLLAFSVPVIGFFMLKSMQGKVQANWAMTGYITGIIALAGLLAREFAAGRGGWAGTSRVVKGGCIGAGLALLLTALSHYPQALNLPPKLDPSSRLRGWEQLGAEVTRLSGLFHGETPVFLFSDSYQVASELAFYVKGQPRTYCINLGRRMNQYDLWPDMNTAADAEKRSGRPVIHGILVRMGDSGMPPLVSQAFEKTEKKRFAVYEGKRLLREYSLFICYNFKGFSLEKPDTY